MRTCSSDGVWAVDVISLVGTGEWLRVKRYGWFCNPVAEFGGVAGAMRAVNVQGGRVLIGVLALVMQQGRDRGLGGVVDPEDLHQAGPAEDF